MACLNVSPYRSRHLNHEEWTSSLTIRCPHQTHTVSRPWKSDGRHCNNFQYKTPIVAAICFDTARFCLSEQVARGKKKRTGEKPGVFSTLAGLRLCACLAAHLLPTVHTPQGLPVPGHVPASSVVPHTSSWATTAVLPLHSCLHWFPTASKREEEKKISLHFTSCFDS